MARTSYPSRGPRTSLVANREQWRAMNQPRPLSYGIRRYLETDHESEIADTIDELQQKGEVSSKLEIRDSFTVTLLSQKVISRQLRRGRVIGLDLGQASAAIVRSPDCANRTRGLEDVPRGRVRVAAGRVLYMTMQCRILEAEQTAIERALDDIGLRATSKESQLPLAHVTLGHTADGEWLNHAEITRTVSALEDQLAAAYDVDPWDTYPYEAAQAAGLLSA